MRALAVNAPSAALVMSNPRTNYATSVEPKIKKPDPSTRVSHFHPISKDQPLLNKISRFIQIKRDGGSNVQSLSVIIRIDRHCHYRMWIIILRSYNKRRMSCGNRLQR